MATNNKIAKCPPLRFPQFNDQWKQTPLGEIGTYIRGLTYNSDDVQESGYIVVRANNITEGKAINFDTELVQVRVAPSTQQMLMANDIAICMANGSSHLVGKASYYNGNASGVCTVGAFCGIFRSTNPLTRWFFQTSIYNSYIYQSIQGGDGAIANLKGEDILKQIYSLPSSLAEQEKIASFLSLIDERIQSCSETITQMKSLRISFYRTISHQRKQEWQNIFLRDILTERKENNSMHYDVYSVSVSRGIVNQIEHLGRSFAAKDTSHYNTVHFGDLVYTKSPTGRFPYGIVKQSRVKSAVAVSPLYGVYIPNNYYIGVVLNNFFESSVRTSNYLAPLIQKGAKNTMNITTQHFLDNKILLPTSSEEQKKMADYLILLDERIEVEEELLKQYEMQKKYLLRQMFI